MAEKRFIIFWNAELYDDSWCKEVGSDFFTKDNGFSESDICEVENLDIGGMYKGNNISDEVRIIRLQDEVIKKYSVVFWEKESVWVRRRVEVETGKEPTAENLDEILGTHSVDYVQEDYYWETSEHEQYDFENDFHVEERS